MNRKLCERKQLWRIFFVPSCSFHGRAWKITKILSRWLVWGLWDVNSWTPEYKTSTPEESSLLGCYWMSGSWHFIEIMVAVIFKGQQCKKTAWYRTRMQYNTLKHHKLHNWWHSITSQKPRFLSNTATRTSNLAEARYIWPQCFVLGSCCLKRLVPG